MAHDPGQDSDQAQMKRNEYLNPPSNIHNQGQASFIQETGAQAKHMAENAMNMAKGAAAGAANMANEAADAVKNTLGMNTTDTSTNQHGNNTNMSGSTNQSKPSNRM